MVGEEPSDPHQLKALLAPYPSEEMRCWPVSPSLIMAAASVFIRREGCRKTERNPVPI